MLVVIFSRLRISTSDPDVTLKPRVVAKYEAFLAPSPLSQFKAWICFANRQPLQESGGHLHQHQLHFIELFFGYCHNIHFFTQAAVQTVQGPPFYKQVIL